MAEHEHTRDEDTLAPFLAAARAQDGGALPAELRARMLADAAQVQAGFARRPGTQRPGTQRTGPQRTGPQRRRGAGRWRAALAALGGWPALGGLAAASAAGLWIGLAPPAFLPDPAALIRPADADVTLFDSYDLSMADGAQIWRIEE